MLIEANVLRLRQTITPSLS